MPFPQLHRGTALSSPSGASAPAKDRRLCYSPRPTETAAETTPASEPRSLLPWPTRHGGCSHGGQPRAGLCRRCTAACCSPPAPTGFQEAPHLRAGGPAAGPGGARCCPRGRDERWTHGSTPRGRHLLRRPSGTAGSAPQATAAARPHSSAEAAPAPASLCQSGRRTRLGSRGGNDGAPLGQGGGRSYLGAQHRAQAGGSSSGCGSCRPCPAPGGSGPQRRWAREWEAPAGQGTPGSLARLLFTDSPASQAACQCAAPPRPAPAAMARRRTGKRGCRGGWAPSGRAGGPGGLGQGRARPDRFPVTRSSTSRLAALRTRGHGDAPPTAGPVAPGAFAQRHAANVGSGRRRAGRARGTCASGRPGAGQGRWGSGNRQRREGAGAVLSFALTVTASCHRGMLMPCPRGKGLAFQHNKIAELTS